MSELSPLDEAASRLTDQTGVLWAVASPFHVSTHYDADGRLRPFYVVVAARREFSARPEDGTWRAMLSLQAEGLELLRVTSDWPRGSAVEAVEAVCGRVGFHFGKETTDDE